MRIVMLTTAGALVFLPAIASAQVTRMDKQRVFAACIDKRFPNVPSTYAQIMTEREVCNREVDATFAGMKEEEPRKIPGSSSGVRDYDLEAFKANERLDREFEAIDRNSDLRRAGLLP